LFGVELDGAWAMVGDWAQSEVYATGAGQRRRLEASGATSKEPARCRRYKGKGDGERDEVATAAKY
jgi:hypothetical protein